MGRLLFWIALIIAAVWLWRRFHRPPRPLDTPRADGQPMVRCAHCGVHVPQDLALQHDQQWYCSQQHLSQGPHSRER